MAYSALIENFCTSLYNVWCRSCWPWVKWCGAETCLQFSCPFWMQSMTCRSSSRKAFR